MPFNIRGMDKEASAYARNDRLHQKGRITTEQRDERNDAVYSRVVANCQHTDTEDDHGVSVCNSCGTRLNG